MPLQVPSTLGAPEALATFAQQSQPVAASPPAQHMEPEPPPGPPPPAAPPPPPIGDLPTNTPPDIAGLQQQATNQAGQYGLDPTVFHAQLAQENGNWDPDVVYGRRLSPAGAIGPGQLMPGTAAGLGVNPYDPSANIEGAARYHRQMLDTFNGDQTAALAAYNWGPGNVQDAQRQYGADWLQHAPAETQQYVSTILGGEASSTRPSSGSAPQEQQQGTPSGTAWLDSYIARQRIGTDEQYAPETGGQAPPAPQQQGEPEPPPGPAPAPPPPAPVSNYHAPLLPDADVTSLEEQRMDGGNATEQASRDYSRAIEQEQTNATTGQEQQIVPPTTGNNVGQVDNVDAPFGSPRAELEASRQGQDAYGTITDDPVKLASGLGLLANMFPTIGLSTLAQQIAKAAGAPEIAQSIIGMGALMFGGEGDLLNTPWGGIGNAARKQAMETALTELPSATRQLIGKGVSALTIGSATYGADKAGQALPEGAIKTVANLPLPVVGSPLGFLAFLAAGKATEIGLDRMLPAIQQSIEYGHSPDADAVPTEMAVQLNEQQQAIRDAAPEETVTLYHGTEPGPQGEQNIRENGLDPGSALTADPGVAWYHAYNRGVEDPAVLAFEVPRSQIDEHGWYFTNNAPLQPSDAPPVTAADVLQQRGRGVLAGASDEEEQPASKPLPGQGGLFGGMVDEQGALNPDVPTNPLAPGVALPEGVNARDLNPTVSDKPRMETGEAIPMFGREETGQTGQMGLGESLAPRGPRPMEEGGAIPGTPQPDVQREPTVEASAALSDQVPEKTAEKLLGDMTRGQAMIRRSDITARPDLFQERQTAAGQATDPKRVDTIVRRFDMNQFDPPTVVPDPDNPGKYIVTKGHHRTEAFGQVNGEDAMMPAYVMNADIRNPEQLRAARLDAISDNSATAPLTFAENVRNVRAYEREGLDQTAIEDRMRTTNAVVQGFQDAARLGQAAIDRAETNKQLQELIKELGRGMRVYGISEEDANGWLKRIEDGPKGQYPTPGKLRETIDKFGAALANVPQGSLFEQGLFKGDRGGILKLIDENARIRTSLQQSINRLKSAQKGATELASGGGGADKAAAARLVKLGEQRRNMLQAEIDANEEDLSRVMRGEAPVDRTPPPPQEPTAGGTGTPPPPPSRSSGAGDDLVSRMITNAESAAIAKPEMERARSEELGRRVVAAMRQLTESDMADPNALRATTQRLRGELAPQDFEKTAPLTANEMKIEIQRQVAAGDVQYFTGLAATEGADRFGNGRIPAAHQMQAMGQVFGPEFQAALERMGDVWKVKRTVEQVMVDRPIEIPVEDLPKDGESLSVDVLKRMLQQSLPNANPATLETVAQQLIDGKRIRLIVGRDGRASVTTGEKPGGYDGPRPEFEDIADQLVPPEHPALEDQSRQLSSQNQVTAGTGETLQMPPNTPLSDDTLIRVALAGRGDLVPEADRLRIQRIMQDRGLIPDTRITGAGAANPNAAHTGLLAGPLLEAGPTPDFPASRPLTTEERAALVQANRPDLLKAIVGGEGTEGEHPIVTAARQGDALLEAHQYLVERGLRPDTAVKGTGERVGPGLRSTPEGQTSFPPDMNAPAFQGTGAAINAKGETGDQSSFKLWKTYGLDPTEPLWHRGWREIASILNIPIQTATFGHEPILRQGFGYAVTHWGAAREALRQMVRVMADPKQAEILRKMRAADPFIKGAMDAGWLKESTKPTPTFVDQFMQKIPGMTRSRESAMTYLSALRELGYADAARRAFKAGERDPAMYKSLWDSISNATGHGLGKSVAFAGINPTFSPQAMVGRWRTVIDPIFQKGSIAPWAPTGRGEAMRSLLGIASVIASVEGLAKLTGADVTFSTGTPLGRVHLGLSTLDPSAGYASMIKLLIGGSAAIYDQDWTGLRDQAGSYLRGQLGPVMDTAVSTVTGQDWQGAHFNLIDAVKDGSLAKSFAPIAAQAIYDAVKENGPIGALYAAPSMGAAGVQTNVLTAERDKATQRLYPGTEHYADLQLQTQRDAVNAQPGVQENVKKSELAQKSDAIKTEYDGKEQDAISAFNSGHAPKTLPEMWNDLGQQRRAAEEEFQRENADELSKIPQGRIQKVTQGYYNMQSPEIDPTTGKPTGGIDFEATRAKQMAYLAGLSTDKVDGASDREIMDDWLKRTEGNKTQEHQKYDAYIQAKDDAGFFKLDPNAQDYSKKLDALYLQHPDLDAQNAYWKGGVENKEPPSLHSAKAVDIALQQNPTGPNRDVKLANVPRPINQSAASMAAWQASEKPLDWYFGSLKTDNQDGFAKALYQKPFAQLTKEQQGSVNSRIDTQARESSPKLDAYLAYWGVDDTLHSQKALSELYTLTAKYGKDRPKPGFAVKLAANAR